MESAYLKRLRELREDNDLSQRQIGDLLGVAQGTVSQYELGKRPLPIEYLIKLCRFYSVSADYILGLSNQKTDNPYKKAPL